MEWWVWVAIAGAVVLLVLVGILCWVMRKKKNGAGQAEGLEDGLLQDDIPDDHPRLKKITVERDDINEKLGVKLNKKQKVAKVGQGPFKRAGIKKGTKIMQVNGKPVSSGKDILKNTKGKAYFEVLICLPAKDDRIPLPISTEIPEEDEATEQVVDREGYEPIKVEAGNKNLSFAAKERNESLEEVIRERDRLAEKVKKLDVNYHPEGCTFCDGTETWGLHHHAPTFSSPHPPDSSEACLPLESLEQRHLRLASDLAETPSYEPTALLVPNPVPYNPLIVLPSTVTSPSPSNEKLLLEQLSIFDDDRKSQRVRAQSMSL